MAEQYRALGTVSVLYYDGLTSAGRRATLRVEGSQVQIVEACAGEEDGELILARAHWKELKFSPPLASTPRLIQLPGGGLCEVTDHDQLNQLIKANASDNTLLDWVHRMEHSWKAVIAATLVLLAVYLTLFKVIIPAASQQIAKVVPMKFYTYISDHALEHFDNFGFFKKTKMTQEDQQEINDFLKENLPAGLPKHEILFFHSQIGANAFALPDGRIILTDSIVKLTEDRRELLAVVLHELGHVHHLHSGQMLVEGSALSLLMFVAFGDFSGAGLILALMQSSYSRDHEQEADAYACMKMKEMDLSRSYLSEILKKLEKSHKGSSEVPEFLRSHPITADRVRDLDSC